MRHLPLSRFRGALLGCAIGESLGLYCTHLADANPVRSRQMSLHLDPNLVLDQPLSFSHRLLLATDSLIQCGGLDLKDWGDRIHAAHLSEPFKLQESMAPILAIPLALFFHEDSVKLRQKVNQVAELEPGKAAQKQGSLVLAAAIAQALNETLHPWRYLPTVIARGEDAFNASGFGQQLRQVQTLLEQDAGLDAAIAQLCPSDSPAPREDPDTAVAIALYCCLSSLEDFRLSVIRAIRTGYQLPLTVALTAALSGAHNSTADIPVAWRIALNRAAMSDSSLGVIHPIPAEAQILQHSDRLFAAWCGTYDPKSQVNAIAAIAAPHMIRPR
ncbi:MAG: ADP-ribosylglycohydrolase family protein [Leptolyngbyaceae bacterium]|nr:ADP-ribosylglycohydrolase family protein [Leptolyngbyaceae bacterium]